MKEKHHKLSTFLKKRYVKKAGPTTYNPLYQNYTTFESTDKYKNECNILN